MKCEHGRFRCTNGEFFCLECGANIPNPYDEAEKEKKEPQKDPVKKPARKRKGES